MNLKMVWIANYITPNNVTVRQTVKEFGISKSMVHTVATKKSGWCGLYSSGE